MAEQRANNNVIITDSDDHRVSEWEAGLPSADDLTPLSHPLIPPELASAFSITPESHRTNLDLNRASQSTLSSIIGGDFPANASANFKSLVNDPQQPEGGGGEDSARKIRRMEAAEDDDDDNNNNNNNGNSSKRARLVWTPQLHKRFVEVVGHLGIKSAVPKAIMQMMNVEGLTRENVASHLQKYRLYLKRMQGISDDGPTPSDHLFSGITNNNNNNHHHHHLSSSSTSSSNVMVVSSVPVYGMMGQSYSGFDYNVMNGQQQQQQRDWGNMSHFASVNSYQHRRISPGADN